MRQCRSPCLVECVERFALGAKWGGLDKYTNYGDTCSKGGWPPQYQAEFYELGSPLDPAQWVLGLTDFVGDSRIKRRVWRNEDGSIIDAGTFYDAQYESDCSVDSTTAGLRCVPKPPSFVMHKSGSCDDPVVVPGGMVCSTSRNCLTPKIAVDSGGNLFEVGEPLGEYELYRFMSSYQPCGLDYSCKTFVFALGKQLSPTDFAEVVTNP